MKLLCFDLDNTLVQSTQVHLKAFQEAFQKYKLPKKTDKEILHFFSLEGSVLVHKLYPKLSKKKIITVVHEHNKRVIKKTARLAKQIPSARATLRKLKKKYTIAILSNCKQKEILAILKAAKIEKNIFDIIVGNDNVRHPKPAPDEIIKAEQLLKMNDGYMIGDSVYDIRAGKRAGVKTIAVCTGIHTKKQLQKERPWKILKSVRDLPKLLL